MRSSYEVILTKSALNGVKTVHSSKKIMKNVRTRMICFNNTKTFYEAFKNTNCHFLFDHAVSLSCDLYSKTFTSK